MIKLINAILILSFPILAMDITYDAAKNELHRSGNILKKNEEINLKIKNYNFTEDSVTVEIVQNIDDYDGIVKYVFPSIAKLGESLKGEDSAKQDKNLGINVENGKTAKDCQKTLSEIHKQYSSDTNELSKMLENLGYKPTIESIENMNYLKARDLIYVHDGIISSNRELFAEIGNCDTISKILNKEIKKWIALQGHILKG